MFFCVLLPKIAYLNTLHQSPVSKICTNNVFFPIYHSRFFFLFSLPKQDGSWKWCWWNNGGGDREVINPDISDSNGNTQRAWLPISRCYHSQRIKLTLWFWTCTSSGNVPHYQKLWCSSDIKLVFGILSQKFTGQIQISRLGLSWHPIDSWVKCFYRITLN